MHNRTKSDKSAFQKAQNRLINRNLIKLARASQRSLPSAFLEFPELIAGFVGQRVMRITSHNYELQLLANSM